MGALDLFFPNTMQEQRLAKIQEMKLAQMRADALRGMEGQFHVEGSQIPGWTERVARESASAGDIPLSMFQSRAPSPTAAIEGMTTDPNRGTTIAPVPPENLPVEYIQPRSAQDMAMRGADIQGRALGQQRKSEFDFYRGLGENYFGEDDINLPETVGFKFNRPEQPGSSYDLIETVDEFGKPVQQYVQEGQEGQWPIYQDPAKTGSGTGSGKDPDKYKRALDTIKALDKRLHPKDVALLTLAAKMGRRLDTDPEVQQRIAGKLSPQELRIVQNALNYIEKQQQQDFGATINDRDNIRGLLFKK